MEISVYVFYTEKVNLPSTCNSTSLSHSRPPTGQGSRREHDGSRLQGASVGRGAWTARGGRVIGRWLRLACRGGWRGVRRVFASTVSREAHNRSRAELKGGVLIRPAKRTCAQGTRVRATAEGGRPEGRVEIGAAEAAWNVSHRRWVVREAFARYGRAREGGLSPA